MSVENTSTLQEGIKVHYSPVFFSQPVLSLAPQSFFPFAFWHAMANQKFVSNKVATV